MSQTTVSKKTADLLNDPINPTLKKMTMPMVIGVILLLLFGIVDTFFVSQLGTDELASISFTFPVTFTVISLNIGLGIGTSATIARLMGAKDTELAKEYGTGALILAVLLALVLTIVGWVTIEPVFTMLGAKPVHMPHIRAYMEVWYLSGILLSLPMVGNSVLRASGDTKTPSIIMAIGGAINAALDPILIFGFGPIPALGIQGAAIATLIAWIVGAVYIVYLLAHKRKLILPRLLNVAEMRETSGDILRIGLPAAGANMLTPLAGAILTRMVSSHGSEAVAAWGVGSRIESIASIVILALSMTLPPFISQNFGANKIDRVQAAYRACVKFVMMWQLLVFAIMWLLSPYIAQAFSEEPQVIRLIQLFLLIVPLGYGLQGIIILTNSSFNALHKPMAALILSGLRLFVFFVPISYLGLSLFSLQGMFWGGVVANVMTATVALLWITRMLKAEAGPSFSRINAK